MKLWEKVLISLALGIHVFPWQLLSSSSNVLTSVHRRLGTIWLLPVSAIVLKHIPLLSFGMGSDFIALHRSREWHSAEGTLSWSTITKQEKSGPHLPKAKESEVISGCLLYVLEIPDAKSWPQLRVCWNETEWSRASVVLGIPGTPDEPCLR